MFKKAFLTNSSGILCSRIFGFLRDLSMANVLGAGIYSDIFFVAFKFPNLFRRIFSEGAFTQSFLPSFIATRKKGQFCVAIFSIFFVFLVAFSLVVSAFSGFFTKILAYGFAPEIIELAKPIVAINFWYLCLIFVANFFSSLLQYKNNFWVSAYNTALLNIAMIVALFVAKDKDAYTIVYFLSYGVLVGGVCQILLHCYSLYKLRFFALFMLGIRDIWRMISKRNSSLGAPFALGENFGNQQTSSLVLSQNFLQDTKSPPQNTRIVDTNKNDSNESSLQNFKPHPKSLPQGEGLASLFPSLARGNSKHSPSLAEGARGWVESTNNSCAKPPKTNNRSNCGGGFVFVENFGRETKLMVCERSKFSTSAKDAPKRKLKKDNALRDIKSFFSQFFPALLGSSTAQIASFIDTLLASFLVSGSVSYLYYANRIFQLPLALFAIATSTALFPMVAKALRNGNESHSLALLSKGFWLLIFALSICVVGGIALKNEIIWLLFERGKFTRADTLEVAKVFMAYLWGLLPYGCARIFSLWLYSLKRQAQAAKISAISLFCGVICSVILMQFWGAFGLALSSSLAGFILFILTIRAFGFQKFLKIIAKPNFFVYLIIILFVECVILNFAKNILGEFYAVI